MVGGACLQSATEVGCMMFDATELCRQLGIQRTALEAWIEAGWLRPVRARNDWRFSTIDLVRAQFILDLRDPMGVNDEGVAVILDLLDQIHGLRRALQAVALRRWAFRKPRLARASRRIRGLRF